MQLCRAFQDRYRDVLASVYLYNEHRGYTALDRVLEAVRVRCPDDQAFIDEICRHRADEHKHYQMFKRWFERRGRMPLAVDSACGHIDRLIQWVFGCPIDELDTKRIVASDGEFQKLCRVIMLTEQRGLAQVQVLLKNPAVRSDKVLMRIFSIICRDEPEHFLPYQRWLESHGCASPLLRERLADFAIHKALLLAKLPALFINPRLPRLSQWPDHRA